MAKFSCVFFLSFTIGGKTYGCDTTRPADGNIPEKKADVIAHAVIALGAIDSGWVDYLQTHRKRRHPPKKERYDSRRPASFRNGAGLPRSKSI